MTACERLSALWGLYWLGELNGWRTPVLSSKATEAHKCCIYTPSDRLVWVRCDGPFCAEYSRPLRYSFWLTSVQVSPGAGPRASKRSLSLFPLERKRAVEGDNETYLHVEEAQGFGYDVVVRKHTLTRLRDPRLPANGFEVVIEGPPAPRRLLTKDAYAALELDLSGESECYESGGVALCAEGDGQIIVDRKEYSVTMTGGKSADLKLRYLPSRWGWLQPFCLVWDYIGEEDAVRSQLVEVYMGRVKYVIMSKDPLEVAFKRGRGAIEIRPKGESAVRVLRRELRDMTVIGNWVSLISGDEHTGEVPKMRVSPHVVVPYRVKVNGLPGGEWSVSLGLSNPAPLDTSFALFVDKPFYIHELSVDGEGAALDRLNYFEGFIQRHSAITVDIRIKKKGETLFQERP